MWFVPDQLLQQDFKDTALSSFNLLQKSQDNQDLLKFWHDLRYDATPSHRLDANPPYALSSTLKYSKRLTCQHHPKESTCPAWTYCCCFYCCLCHHLNEVTFSILQRCCLPRLDAATDVRQLLRIMELMGVAPEPLGRFVSESGWMEEGFSLRIWWNW